MKKKKIKKGYFRSSYFITSHWKESNIKWQYKMIDAIDYRIANRLPLIRPFYTSKIVRKALNYIMQRN